MFLAIAVDNLGDAEEMDEIQKEKDVSHEIDIFKTILLPTNLFGYEFI